MESGTRHPPVNGPGGAARGARLPESLAPPRNDFRNGRIANLARKATLPFSPPASPFLSVDSIRHITMKTRLPFLSPASVGNLSVVPSVSARRSFGTRWRAFRLMAVIVALPIAGVERAPAAAPATQGAGVLEGRVFNATSGVALGNARITITPGGLTAYSDASGEFRVTNVPPGEVRVSVSYAGMATKTEIASASAGAVTRLTVDLARAAVAGEKSGDQVVELATFQVTAEREMSAQALAMNEQRAAVNIKNVVAMDEFGNRGDENLGEFLQFLSGVSVSIDGDVGPNGASLRGFSPSFSNVTIDGGSVATARGTNRQATTTDVPFSNVSRVEVTKVPTPDQRASGLGGSINLIPSNGFEVKKRVLNYRVSTLFHNTNGASMRWNRGPNPDASPRYTLPSANVSYQGPLSERFAVTASLYNTWRLNPSYNGIKELDVQPTWDRGRNIQTAGAWQSLMAWTQTYGGQLGFAWKPTSRDLVSISGEMKNYLYDVSRSRLAVTYGAGATGGETFTQGAATGVGSTAMGGGSGIYQRDSKQQQLNLKYAHRGDLWRFDLDGGLSAARYQEHDADNGYFTTINAQLTNLVIRGDDIFRTGIARQYTVRDRTGAPVDIFKGEDYTINSAVARSRRTFSENSFVRANGSREFNAIVPFALKFGVASDQQERAQRNRSFTYTFRPNGASNAPALRAGNFDVFDEDYLRVAPKVYGHALRDISHTKMYDLYLRNPSWFVLDEPGAHQNQVTGSFEFTETISAAYLRGDLRLLQDRLTVVGGVRLEETDIKGKGPLDDINAQYQRNPDGSFVRTAAGARVLLTNDALTLRRLRYKERGASTHSNYHGYYPSINASYRVSDHFVARTAYAQTIGRPGVNLLIPGTTISDPEATNPTITVNNPGLRPWTADNYDLTFEVYDVKGGSGAVGFFQKDVRDFFGSVQTPVTEELLNQQGLPTDGTYNGYQFRTMENAGNARVRGVEFSYRQQLFFLPGLLKSLQLNANITKLRLEGGRLADFSGFVPMSFSTGLNFIRPRYLVKFTYVYQDGFATSAVNASATELPNTFAYQNKYKRYGVEAEYSLKKHCTVFLGATDLGRRSWITMQYAPSTPDYARYTRNQTNGYYIVTGLKGRY